MKAGRLKCSPVCRTNNIGTHPLGKIRQEDAVFIERGVKVTWFLFFFFFSHTHYLSWYWQSWDGCRRDQQRKLSPQRQHETGNLNASSCSELQYCGKALTPECYRFPWNCQKCCIQWAKPNTVGTDGIEKAIPMTKLQKCCSNRKTGILCLMLLREAKMFCTQGLLRHITIHRIKNMASFSLILF